MNITVNVTDEQLVAFYAALPEEDRLSGLDGVKILTRTVALFCQERIRDRYTGVYIHRNPEQWAEAEHRLKQMFEQAEEELERENLDN